MTGNVGHLCPHVWPGRPQTRTGVLEHQLKHWHLTALEARSLSQGVVDSVSSESVFPGWLVLLSGCALIGPCPGMCTHQALYPPLPKRTLTLHRPPHDLL